MIFWYSVRDGPTASMDPPMGRAIRDRSAATRTLYGDTTLPDRRERHYM